MAKRKTYPGSIRRRGDSFQLRMDVDGESHSWTLEAKTKENPKGVTREDVEAFAREKYRELRKKASLRAHGILTGILLSELLERFEEDHLPTLAPNTQAAYHDSLKPIRAYFVDVRGDMPVDQVRAQHVKAFLSWRRVRGPHGKKRKRPLSNRTLVKDRAVLHRIFAIAEDLEYRDGNPVGRVDRPKVDGRDPVILTDEQYGKLLEECSHRPELHLYALVLGETGVRSDSEALWLRWEYVDLEDGFLWIQSGRHGHRTKSGKGRWCPMTPRLREAFQEHMARFRLKTYDGERSPWVFHHARDRGKAKAGARIKSMRHAFNSAAERAGLPADFVKHDLRHRRVTKWLADGKNPVHVKEAVGHSDLRVTMQYTHLAREHLKSLVKGEPREGSGEEPESPARTGT